VAPACKSFPPKKGGISFLDQKGARHAGKSILGPGEGEFKKEKEAAYSHRTL
jgi:hypothetical protein